MAGTRNRKQRASVEKEGHANSKYHRDRGQRHWQSKNHKFELFEMSSAVNPFQEHLSHSSATLLDKSSVVNLSL